MRSPLLLFPSLRQARGFTLVELLVAIGLVSLLAAMLLPTAGRMFTRSNETKCVSGLRQLQQANITYSTENDGWFVPVFSNNSSNPPDRTPWHNNRTFTTMLGCPTTQAAAIPKNIRCPMADVPGLSGYGYNFTGLSGGINDPGFVRRVRQSQLPRPGQTIAFIDALDWQVHRSASDKYKGEEGSLQQATAYRHGSKDQAHAVFWDGHVETIQRKVLAGNRLYWDMLESDP